MNELLFTYLKWLKEVKRKITCRIVFLLNSEYFSVMC